MEHDIGAGYSSRNSVMVANVTVKNFEVASQIRFIKPTPRTI
jgi:hypothetical protein